MHISEMFLRILGGISLKVAALFDFRFAISAQISCLVTALNEKNPAF